MHENDHINELFMYLGMYLFHIGSRLYKISFTFSNLTFTDIVRKICFQITSKYYVCFSYKEYTYFVKITNVRMENPRSKRHEGEKNQNNLLRASVCTAVIELWFKFVMW